MKKDSWIDENENIFNVPNLLTMARLAGVPIFIACYALGRHRAALAVFILSALTDVLDGVIARRFGLITRFGKLMDPLADKLLTLSALVCLAAQGLGGIFVLRKKHLVVQSDFIGKAATVVFIAAITATFLHDFTAPWDFVLQCGAVTLSLVAMLFYILDTIRKVRDQEKNIA